MEHHTVSRTTAVSEASLEIPLIDFSHFLSGDPAAKQRTAQEVLAGFQNAGFIYLSNHGVPDDVVKKTFAESIKFFERPREEKDALAWTTPEVIACLPYTTQQSY
jgi:isopenicillin N synthase-like dioxygenase